MIRYQQIWHQIAQISDINYYCFEIYIFFEIVKSGFLNTAEDKLTNN